MIVNQQIVSVTLPFFDRSGYVVIWYILADLIDTWSIMQMSIV